MFCYLVVPAVAASLLTEKLLNRLYVGWLIGALVSFVGVWYSYVEDLPSGPTIVVCFVVFLILVAAVLFVVRSKSPGKQLIMVMLVAFALVMLAFFSTFFKVHEQHSPIVKLEIGDKSERLLALQIIEQDKKLITLARKQISILLKDKDEEIRLAALKIFAKNWDNASAVIFYNALLDDSLDVREFAVRVLYNHSSNSVLPFLWNAIRLETDDYLKVEMAESLLELGDPRAIAVLIKLIESGESEMVKKEAYEHLSAHVDFPSKFSYLSAEGLSLWFKNNRSSLRWHPLEKKFVVD